MSKIQLSFKIIEYKPIIPEYNDYYYQILCHETKFNDFIYSSKNNKITDYTNMNKNLKYIIKLMKKGKIIGVGNLMINQEVFIKKIKQKKYKNINIFISENNYKKIFPNTDLTKITKFKTSITLSIEVNIKYNIKEKEISPKKLKLMRRNFSYQERGNNNENSIKSSNNFTTSTTNINTFNNINSPYDNENNNIENNINMLSSDKYIITTPPYLLSPNNISSPLSDSNINNKKKRIIKKGIINNISFKNNTKNIKNKLSDNSKKYNIFDFKNKINQGSSRNTNNRFLFNKKKFNLLITQESSSSKNSNTIITHSSLINSALLEQNDENDISDKSINITINNLDTIQNILNNKSAYNQDNDNDSLDLYLKELENKKEKIINEQYKRNKKLFIQDEKYKKIYSSIKNYENKINDTKIVINKIKDKNDLINYRDEIIIKTNRDIIPIISKIKESKEIENNIINSILDNFIDKNLNKNKNNYQNNIEKYDKNLMIKMLKNVIQSNNNVDLYLDDENKKKMKYICDKYNIFGSIIEDVEE